jgi:hypothetical protein
VKLVWSTRKQEGIKSKARYSIQDTYYAWMAFQTMHNSDGKLGKCSERRYMKWSRERDYICKRRLMEE